MRTPLTRHQTEIQRNLEAWQKKPLLRTIYAGFYRRIVYLLDTSLPGRLVEIGSGVGNLAPQPLARALPRIRPRDPLRAVLVSRQLLELTKLIDGPAGLQRHAATLTW